VQYVCASCYVEKPTASSRAPALPACELSLLSGVVAAIRWALVVAHDTEQTERVERRHAADRERRAEVAEDRRNELHWPKKAGAGVEAGLRMETDEK